MTFHFRARVVFNQSGSSVKFARGVRSKSVTDGSGNPVTGFTTNGGTFDYLTADASGWVTFTHPTQNSVQADFGAGPMWLFSDELVMNFTGSKGDKGDKGDTGATGPQGPVGPAGPTGPAGGINGDVDGGATDTTYLAAQSLDGGAP